MPLSREELVSRSNVHSQWRDILIDALDAVEPEYLASLADSTAWLPGIEQLFSAFRRDRHGVRYILIGESPYPRPQSANGIAFYDAAVDQLWSVGDLGQTVVQTVS